MIVCFILFFYLERLVNECNTDWISGKNCLKALLNYLTALIMKAKLLLIDRKYDL